MNKTASSLQKLTESEIKINNILAMEIIKREDFDELSKAEKEEISKILSKELNESKGIERDNLLKKIDLFINETTRNELWENNHSKITGAIAYLIKEYGRMPSKNEIATKSELSRQTIHKHLKDYANHPLYIEQIEQFRFMTSKVLAKIFRFALDGDIKAAKLYFDIIGNNYGHPTNKNTLIQNQNNFIQINGTVISQDTVMQLNIEQLTSIEAILKSVNK